MKPKVVVMIDGGICSQIMQYLFGRTFAETGMDVVYDWNLMRNGGRDVSGRFERNFDLQKLMSSLELPVVFKFERKLYNFLFRCNQMSFEVSETKRSSYLDYCPPVFLGDDDKIEETWLAVFSTSAVFLTDNHE